MTSTATPLRTTAPPGADQRWTPRLWGTLLVVCSVLFLDGLDLSMVGVALPSIGAELGLSTSSLQWIVSGYVLGYGGLLLLGGRAADLLGRRQVLLVALAVFAAASLLGAFVDDGVLLIATRFIKGVSAAFTAPAGLSIITTTFPEGPSRNRALSIYTATGASGFSLGLVFGGIMTEVGWRWTFLLPVPIAVAVLAAAYVLIPNQGRPARRHGYDIAGAATSTAALLLLVYAITEAPRAGWASPRTLLTFALVAGLLAAFVTIERRVAHPLVRLGILRNRSLVRANLAAMAMFGSYAGYQFIVTLYLQNTLGWSPMQMALALLPTGLIVAFGGPRAGGLVNRFGTSRVLVVAYALFVLGYGLFLRIGAESQYLAVILPSTLLLGFGFALGFPTLNIQATNGVTDDEQGLASGLVQTSFQVGGAAAMAAVTAVMTAAGAGLDGYYPALALVAAIAVAGLAVTLAGIRQGQEAAVSQPQGAVPQPQEA